MRREELGSLLAFVTVAKTRSFTKAAGRLGTSQSSLSHSLRRLEERLGVRLLDRTTRSVTLTEIGRQLLGSIEPAITEIRHGLERVNEARERIAGSVRISSADHAAETLVWPVVKAMRARHPNVRFEIHVANEMVDIVGEGFDAGIRLGDNVPRDMVAVRIGMPERTVIVCSPDYLALKAAPSSIEDVTTSHECIVRTLPTLGGVATWRIKRRGRIVNVRIPGALIFNRPELVVDAALAGFGVAQVLETQVRPLLKSGQLVELLPRCSVSVPGYSIYYPKTRQPTPAFTTLLDTLRSKDVA